MWLEFLSILGACWSQPILSAQGKVLGTSAIYHRHACLPDKLDLQLIEEEAQLAALAIEKSRDDTRLQLAAGVFTHAREGSIITGMDYRIVEVNDMFSHITGYSREEAMGQLPRALLQCGLHGDEFYDARRQAILEHGFWSGEMWNRPKNGEIFAEMLTISVVRDAQGVPQNHVALFTDITPMKEHQRRLENIAHFDSLTGLPNRVLLADRLQQALTQCQRRSQFVAVVYFDLDGFKAANDTHGHGVGDTLARIGGDDFVAVLVNLEQLSEYEPVLRRMLTTASDPVHLADAAVQVSASIGVTIYPHDGSEADLLLRHADQVMYVAKQAGKNRYHQFARG